MINGQKVVKVFCHEQEAQEGFDRVNDALFESAYKANKYANILMPILINIGNIQYVIVAMVGGALALSGVDGGITLGVIASLPPAVQELYQPHQPDLPAAQLRDHGPGRRAADLRPDG